MRGWRDRALAAALAAHFAWEIDGALGEERQQAAFACGGEVLTRGRVVAVTDGRTVTLEDGREARLAGIEVPPLPEPAGGAPPGGGAARDALAALVADAEVTLVRAEGAPAIDRYGRRFGFAVAAAGGNARSVQTELVAAGAARVAARVGSRACADDLLHREAAARHAGLGLWANSYYLPRSAHRPADVLAERGQFALVEGTVVSVRESGATIYVNFGRRWSEDFTVTIAKRSAHGFAAAGVEPKSLAGRRIRVRGWVEERGGPWIEATRPEQIEFTDRP